MAFSLAFGFLFLQTNKITNKDKPYLASARTFGQHLSNLLLTPAVGPSSSKDD